MEKRERLSLNRGKRLMVQAPQHVHSRGIVPTSTTSLVLLLAQVFPYFILLLLFFLIPFVLSDFLISFFFFLRYPFPHPLHSQRRCPQNYPDFSLKDSAWNHHITMERLILHFSLSPLLALEVKLQAFYLLSPFVTVSHIPAITLCLHTICSLSLKLSVNGVLSLSDVIASFSFGRMSL